jgi:RimJ/RimL family protein N-acetyltransferase
MHAVTVRLRPLRESDLVHFPELLADPDVLRFTRVPEPPPADFALDWLAWYDAGRLEGTREGFAAFDDAGEFVGLGLAPEIDRQAREIELGYIVRPRARGRGVATEILRLLTDWAFAEAGAMRVYLRTDVENQASQRVAERCDYHREGVMRSVYLKQDRRADFVLWSRLPSDPEPPAPARPP